METGSGLRCNSGFQGEWPEHLVNYTLQFEVCQGTFSWLTPIVRSFGTDDTTKAKAAVKYGVE